MLIQLHGKFTSQSLETYLVPFSSDSPYTAPFCPLLANDLIQRGNASPLPPNLWAHQSSPSAPLEAVWGPAVHCWCWVQWLANSVTQHMILNERANEYVVSHPLVCNEYIVFHCTNITKFTYQHSVIGCICSHFSPHYNMGNNLNGYWDNCWLNCGLLWGHLKS